MAGLAGMIAKADGFEGAGILPLMLKSLTRNSQDTSGTYENLKLRLQLGWVDDGRAFPVGMPIWNGMRDVGLFLSGGGHRFELGDFDRNSGQKEADFIRRLSGNFGGVIVNLRESRVVLFVDRFGLKRFYFHESPDALFFSTEAKALLKILPKARRFEEKCLGEYFSIGFIPDNRTLFAGIGIIPAGSLWLFPNDSEWDKEFYFQKEIWETLPSLESSDFEEGMKEALKIVIARTFRGRERLSFALDGGIETRTILAYAPPDPLKVSCFTACMTSEDSADVQIAKKVADFCQQQHFVIGISRNFFSEFPSLAKRAVVYSDGAVDVSGSLGLYVHRLIRELAPECVLSDIGFCSPLGAPISDPEVAYMGVFDESFLPLLQAGRANHQVRLQEHDLSKFYFELVPWSLSSRIELAGAYTGVKLPYIEPELVSMYYQAPKASCEDARWLARLLAAGDARLARIPFAPEVEPGSPLALRADRALLKRLHQMRPFESGRIFRRDDHLASHNIPAPHPARTFGGYEISWFRNWYKENLSKYVHDILLDKRTRQRPYFNGKRLEEMLGAHQAGRCDCTAIIHRLLTSELVQRQLIEVN